MRPVLPPQDTVIVQQTRRSVIVDRSGWLGNLKPDASGRAATKNTSTGRFMKGKAISTVNALRVDTIPSELTSAKLQLQNVPCWRTIPPVLTQLLFRLLKNPTGVPPVKLLPGPSGRNRRPQRRLHTALPYSNKNYGHLTLLRCGPSKASLPSYLS